MTDPHLLEHLRSQNGLSRGCCDPTSRHEQGDVHHDQEQHRIVGQLEDANQTEVDLVDPSRRPNLDLVFPSHIHDHTHRLDTHARVALDNQTADRRASGQGADYREGRWDKDVQKVGRLDGQHLWVLYDLGDWGVSVHHDLHHDHSARASEERLAERRTVYLVVSTLAL